MYLLGGDAERQFLGVLSDERLELQEDSLQRTTDGYEKDMKRGQYLNPHLSLLNRHLLPGLESLLGSLLGSLQLLRGRLGYLEDELSSSGVVQVNPLGGLRVLKLSVDEVLHLGNRRRKASGLNLRQKRRRASALGQHFNTTERSENEAK
jgi:hypothetical protein